MHETQSQSRENRETWSHIDAIDANGPSVATNESAGAGALATALSSDVYPNEGSLTRF